MRILRLDDPVVDGAGSRSTSLPAAATHVVEHFAQAGGDRPILGRSMPAASSTVARRSLMSWRREVNIDAIFERDDHLRQAEFGNRSHFLQARQAADGLLDGKRDSLFDFFRPQRRSDGVDLHLNRRGVGKGIDIQVTQRHSAGDGEDGKPQNHQKPVPQRKIDDAIESIHGWFSGD